MKLKGAVDSNVSSSFTLFYPFPLFLRVLYGIRLGADLWAAVESTLTMTLMFPDFRPFDRLAARPRHLGETFISFECSIFF